MNTIKCRKRARMDLSAIIQSLLVIASVAAISLNIAWGEGNPKNGSIVGSVFDKLTNESLPNANVMILGSTLGTSTDLEGRFVISKLPAGTYEVQVSVLGYAPSMKSVKVVVSEHAVEQLFAMSQSDIRMRVVDVQASPFVRAPDAPLSTQSFSGRELRNTAGGLDDVVRAVRMVAGVSQVKADRTDLIVRGGAPSENLFLIDHISVPYINHFSTQGAGGGAVSIVDMNLLSGTSFSTGGFGARYGDKLSSVLQVGIREGRSDAFHSKASVSATQIGVTAEGPLAGFGSFLVSARRSYLDMVFKIYGFGYAPQFTDFLGKANLLFGANDRVSLLVIGAKDDINFFNGTDAHRYENSRLLFSNQNHIVLGGTWQHMFVNGYSSLTARHSASKFNYLQFTVDLNPLFEGASVENETSVNGDVVVKIGTRSEFSAGFEAKSVDVGLSIDASSYGYTPFNGSLSGLPGKAAAYTQFSQTLNNLKLTLGIRGDYCSLIDQRMVFAPRFSSILSISPALNVTATIGRYYQAPSYVWLAANSSNKGLSFISVDQFVFGIEDLVLSDLRVNLETYVKRYSGYPASLNHPSLTMANTGAGPGGMGERFASFGLDSLVSRGTGLAKGIELSIQKKLSAIPCYGMMSLSFSETSFTALDGVSRPGDYDQRIVLNIGGGYLLGEQWEFSTKFKLYTGRPYTPFAESGVAGTTAINSRRVDLNHQLDVRVARQWSFASVTLETYLDVQNVYNRKPIDAPMYSERRKRVEQVPALGIIPTVGIALQF